MGMGPSKGFSSGEVQDIVTKKHDATQNKIAKEDAETATFAAGEVIFITAVYVNKLLLSGCFWGVQLAFQRVPGVASSMVRSEEKETAVEIFTLFSLFRWVTRLAASCTPPTMRSVPARLVRRLKIFKFRISLSHFMLTRSH